MREPGVEQIRSFRLHSHHLDAEYDRADVERLAGACGMQNTPPGAWETALYNRAPGYSAAEMEELLYREKLLVQAWSVRGTPIVFPASESDTFLSALIPEEGEPWIYTNGISLALDFLQMNFDDLFRLLMEVIPKLDDTAIESKESLDQTLAEWMLPFLPAEKKKLWNQPSMYGRPDRQTVGGAVVSFMLRPASFHGMVVFGERRGSSPSFTSYKRWIGQEISHGEDAVRKLVRKYLHCYGPATADMFALWLGCSGRQARRMWASVSEEMEPVAVSGKKAWILSDDREHLFSSASFSRELLLLGGHDPFLDQRDRLILQPSQSLHKQIWKLTSNPGAVVYRGEIIGVWTGRKKGKGLDVKITLWTAFAEAEKLYSLVEKYAVFRGLKLADVELENG